jgi:outer membrane receptor protein involved in Fe transport
MKKFYFLTCTIIFLFGLTAFSQTAQIFGIIKDEETGEPLVGASVRSGKAKTISDASGSYKISIEAGDATLTISFIGYKTLKQELSAGDGEEKRLDIKMKSEAFKINEVTIASQYKKNAAKETVSTDVLNKNQIKNTNSNDLSEAVSKTPGVLVQDGQISIRGGSSYSYGVGSRTAVLVDGQNFSSADLGEGQSKATPLSNVKQIEVLKGAASVVYGSGAMNGVINVVTEWPTDEIPKTEIEINVGVYDDPKIKYQKWYDSQPFFTNINANYQRRIKDVQLVVSGNITGVKSYIQTNDELRAQVAFKTRYIHPKIAGLNFGVNGTLQGENSERSFLSQDLDTFAYVTASGSGDRYLRATVDPFVTYTHSKGHTAKLNVRYMTIFRKGGGDDPNAFSNQISFDDQYQYRWKNMLVLTAGIPFNVGISQSNLYPGKQINYTAAAYAQLEFNYKILSLQGGLRYEVAGVDTYRIFPKYPVFRSGLNVQAAKATFIRASWGQGYRIPTIGERYVNAEFSGILVVPNDTLEVERSWSAEIGFKQGFQIKNWKGFFDFAFFWQEYTNYIEYQLGLWPNAYSNGQQIFPDSFEKFGVNKILGLKPLNVDNARIFGYEATIVTQGKIGPVGLQMLAGYTYTYPSQKTQLDSSGNKQSFNFGKFMSDAFSNNFKRVQGDDVSKLLLFRTRHLVRADIEVSYWKAYLGATFFYGSFPEKIPPLFDAVSLLVWGSVDAFRTQVVDKHQKGDWTMDLRAGIKFNEKASVGFIVKNLTNRLYYLRPGKLEPTRNFTVQFRYAF